MINYNYESFDRYIKVYRENSDKMFLSKFLNMFMKTLDNLEKNIQILKQKMHMKINI